jgi:hypothetical protein
MFKKLTSKVIGFVPHNDFKHQWSIIETPSPARTLLPDWYKKESLFFNKNNRHSVRVAENLTYKACVPFLDSLTAGYLLKTWTDIQVSQKDGNVQLLWSTALVDPVVPRTPSTIPTPIGCNPTHFGWVTPFGFQIPKGYSALITHPLNRTELPFVTSSGLIDEGVIWGGIYSFWIQEGFEGVIPAGTPYAQVIPFKLDSWTSERREDLADEAEKKSLARHARAMGFYKKVMHKKKHFD